MTKVLIADDHKMFVECLQLVLDKDQYEVVGTASDGMEALRMALEHRPHLVILDVNMPGMHGLDVAREIQRQLPLTRLVFLTCRTDETCIRDAMRLGAKAYILKSESLNEIQVALRKVVSGDVYISVGFLGTLIVQWLQNREKEEDSETLSLRERQVLKLIAEGHSTKEIAALLDISPKTADSHRTRLMAKLGVHEVAGLVRYAIRQGIVAA
jgi:DNA-binding NarL/FixJ family response regulator